jgi:hypothetical protein
MLASEPRDAFFSSPTAPTKYLPFNRAIEEPELFNMVQDKRVHTWDASIYEVPNDDARSSMLSQADNMLSNSVWDENSWAVGRNHTRTMEASECATYKSLGYETIAPPSSSYETIVPPSFGYDSIVDYTSTSRPFDDGSRHYETMPDAEHSAYEHLGMEEDI